MQIAVGAGVVAFVLALALTALCKPLALRLGVVARPRADRWARQVVPLLGGVAIAGATTLATVVLPATPVHVWVLLGASLFLFAFGLVDDVRALRPQTKLVAQILAASVVAASGSQMHLTDVPVVDVLITMVWIVGITNAFNLLDNMDGLAAGVAAIAAAFRLGFAAVDGDVQAAALASVLLGATLGFLVHNRPPASIFMGDAGSMFIGCLVAGLSLVGRFPYSRSAASVLLIPVLLLLVPIFDTTFVTVTRVLSGRPVSVGGRDHTSHRLVALGLSEGRTLVILYGLALAGGAIATLSYHFGISFSVVLVTLLALGLAALARHLAAVRVPDTTTARTATAGGFVRVLTDFSYKRQVATVAIDAALIVAAYYAAYQLRFEGAPPEQTALFVKSLPILLACQVAALYAHRTYQGLWRYTSVLDLVRLTQAVTIGTVLAVVVVVLAYRFEGFSRAVFVLDWVLLVVFVCGSRVSLRVLGEVLQHHPPGTRRVLIYGASDGGTMTLRALQHNEALGRHVVGFLDDDHAKHGLRIHGRPVLGGIDALARACEDGQVDEVVVSTSRIAPARLDQLARRCADLGVALVTLALRLEAPQERTRAQG